MRTLIVSVCFSSIVLFICLIRVNITSTLNVELSNLVEYQKKVIESYKESLDLVIKESEKFQHDYRMFSNKSYLKYSIKLKNASKKYLETLKLKDKEILLLKFKLKKLEGINARQRKPRLQKI